MIALELIIASLATWRIAYMVTAEEGPFGVFFYLKNALGAYDFGEDGKPLTWHGRGIVCIYCVSVWIALFCSLPIIARWELGWLSLAVPFAVSAGALYLHRLVRRE